MGTSEGYPSRSHAIGAAGTGQLTPEVSSKFGSHFPEAQGSNPFDDDDSEPQENLDTSNPFSGSGDPVSASAGTVTSTPEVSSAWSELDAILKVRKEKKELVQDTSPVAD